MAASIRFIAPLGRLCAASSASSACAITSTMALPIAVTSNFFAVIGPHAVRLTPGATVSGSLEILSNERRELTRGGFGNCVGTSNERVLQRRRALARAFEWQT